MLDDLNLLVTSSALTETHDAKILIVDDNPANVALLEAILEEEDFSNVSTTTDPFRVIPMWKEQRYDLILLDIRMPGMSGIEILRQLGKLVQDDLLSVIVLTAQTDAETRRQALEAGAKDFLTKPFEDWEVLLRIRNALQTRLYYMRQSARSDLLEHEVLVRTREIRETQYEIVQRLGAAGELRDNETGAHVERMSRVCNLLALKRGQGERYAELLQYASTMHDVGKIGIPDRILLKPGKLTEEEWLIMREHPRIGARIIGNHKSQLISLARETALYHHERWDGNGYPHGLARDEIPISARIVGISDVFDALTSERPYKKAWSEDLALKFLQQQSGRQFEPQLVELFSENIEQICEIRACFSDQEVFPPPA